MMQRPCLSDVQTASYIYLSFCNFSSDLVRIVTLIWKAARNMSTCKVQVYKPSSYVSYLQCSTTDRHCKCTDDVATEFVWVCFFPPHYHLLELHSISTCFHCQMFVCFYLCELTPNMSNILFMSVWVKWRPRHCSRAESWPLSDNVTIPTNVVIKINTSLEMILLFLVFCLLHHNKFWGLSTSFTQESYYCESFQCLFFSCFFFFFTKK